MKLSEFKAGNYESIDAYRYKYFLPSFINKQLNIDDPILISQLEKASLAIGELNTMGKLVPNIDLFINSFIMNEATYSSRIEGTQTSIEDAYQEEKNIPPEKKDDWLEVQNYNKAMEETIKKLAKIPISTRLIKSIHKTLLLSGRGKHKTPGELRISQNWLGGSSLQTAEFIPPHHNFVNDLMNDFEKFLYNEELVIPELVRIGIAHYQFETIHPFLDGNGRVGRMLISLLLIDKKILEKPLLYSSVFFDNYRQVYYDKLTKVREKNDLTGWLLFFLEGVEKVARFSVESLQETLKLKAEAAEKIREKTGRRASNNLRLLELLFETPFIIGAVVEKKLEVSKTTAINLIKDFIELKLLEKETEIFLRNRVFIFRPYANILRKDFKEFENKQRVNNE